MFLRFSINFVFWSMLIVGNTWASTEECIQAPSRTTSCPNVLFKRAVLAVPSLGIKKHEVVCICLSDIKRNFNPQSQSIDSIKQQVLLQRIAINYGLREEDIIKLVKD